jgi:hypothetical protein
MRYCIADFVADVICDISSRAHFFAFVNHFDCSCGANQAVISVLTICFIVAFGIAYAISDRSWVAELLTSAVDDFEACRTN